MSAQCLQIQRTAVAVQLVASPVKTLPTPIKLGTRSSSCYDRKNQSEYETVQSYLIWI